MPLELLADSGLDALTHATESYVNIRSNDFTRGPSLQAVTLIMEHLPAAFGAQDRPAMEHMHYAAAIAGMAFSNTGNHFKPPQTHGEGMGRPIQSMLPGKLRSVVTLRI